MRRRYWIIGGIVVVGGVIALSVSGHPHRTATASHRQHTTTPSHAPHTHNSHPKKSGKSPQAPKTPKIPTCGSGSGSSTASFQTVVGQAPPDPIQTVTLPWQKGTQWAVEPAGMKMDGNALTTLWFAEKTGSGHWHWIPTTLPGQPSSKLPAAIKQSLLMAYSLHLGDSGPTNTVGPIPWQGLQGKVANPSGWTLRLARANASPLFAPTVGLTLFQKSYTGSFSGYYGMEAAFDGENAKDGTHALVGFVSRTGQLKSIVKTPPYLL